MKKARHYFLAIALLLLAGGVSGQTLSNLSLDASSPDDLTIDQLICTYTEGGGVSGTTSAWYKDGVPIGTLYLPFDAWAVGGGTGVYLDFSGSDNHAVEPADEFAQPEEAVGINGSGGFVFDGDAYLIVDGAMPTDASYTKTVWVNKAENSSGFRNIMSSATFELNNHSLKLDLTGRLNAGHSEGSSIVVDTDTLNSNQWYFLAVTYDDASGEMALFRDGVEVDRQSVPVGLRAVADDTVLIGSMNYNWFWYGHIDEPRVYNVALSPEQIASLYTTGDNTIVPEETSGGEDWYVDVTPFASGTTGPTYTSNTLTVRTLVVSDIPDQSVSEGSTFTVIDLDAYMVDYEFADNQITWTATGNSELSVSISAANFATITIPDADWYGSENITFTANNPNGDNDGTEVSFTVVNVNDAPVVSATSAQTTPEDVTLTGLTVDFTDPDPDSHTITILSSDPNVSMDNLSGNTDGSTYDLVPVGDWNGTTTITVTVTDNGSGNLSDTDVFTLEVTAVNDPPVLVENGDEDVDEDDSLIGLSVVFSDPDGDSHTITVESNETGVDVQNLSGNISGSTYDLVPDADWNGTATIVVTVTDDGTGALTDVETYTLTVNPMNDAPVLTEIGPQSTPEDITFVGTVTFDDVDVGDAYTITVTSDEGNVSVANISGNTTGSTYDLIPAADWIGTAQITVTVTDDGTGALSDTETYTLTVNATNDAPVIAEIGDQVVDEDNILIGRAVNYTDIDGSDSHTITVVSDEANVSVTNLSGDVSGSTYDLEPAADWNGSAQITVTVTDDGAGTLSDTETYTLTVNPTNDAPVITETGDQSTDEDVVLSLSVVFTDIDVTDSHIFTVVSSDDNVTVANLSGNTYDLVPAADWNGSTQITTTVTDNGVGALADTETFTLTVDPTNDAPIDIELSNLSVDENSAIGTTVGVFSTVELDDGDTHTYTLVEGAMDNDNASFSIDGDELKTAALPDFETKNIYWIRAESADGDGETVEQTFVITVNNMQETGIPNAGESLSFKVYPIPAIDHVTVEVDNPDNKELHLEIYSNAGRLVHDEVIFTKTRVDLAGFTDGMYILRIKGDNVYETRKIIMKDR